MNRREFLIGSASLLLAACARTGPGALVTAAASRRARYLVSTQSMYWSSEQDFSAFGELPEVEISSLPGFAKGQAFSVLTAVNDDGTGLERRKFPMHYHCAAAGPRPDVIYLVGNGRPSAVIALDAATLEVVDVVTAGKGEAKTFGGHAAWLPDGDHVAFTMNGFKKGAHDFISIREARTLKEVGRYSTYGFQAHEIRLSPDGKYFVCGHYGSYLGQGPYAGMSIYGAKGGYSMDHAPKHVYPSSVTLVDAENGKLVRLLSDVHAGQEGHADADDRENVFLPNLPARLESRARLDQHPRFREGVNDAEDHGEFAVTDHSVGISVAYDRKFNEVLVPHRGALVVYVSDAGTGTQREVNLPEQLSSAEHAWLKPTPDFLNGLAFHPDGRHYVISTSNGFLALERGSHKVNHALTFPLPLKVHSHLALFRG